MEKAGGSALAPQTMPCEIVLGEPASSGLSNRSASERAHFGPPFACPTMRGTPGPTMQLYTRVSRLGTIWVDRKMALQLHSKAAGR
jgi:hypothetical protein